MKPCPQKREGVLFGTPSLASDVHSTYSKLNQSSCLVMPPAGVATAAGMSTTPAAVFRCATLGIRRSPAANTRHWTGRARSAGACRAADAMTIHDRSCRSMRHSSATPSRAVASGLHPCGSSNFRRHAERKRRARYALRCLKEVQTDGTRRGFPRSLPASRGAAAQHCRNSSSSNCCWVG